MINKLNHKQWAKSQDQIGDLFKIEAYLSQGDFNSAQSYLNAYSPETNVQENYKTYFQLYRKYAQYDSLSAYDSLSLFVLANQFPAVDVPAIHKARSLFDLIYGGLTFYNDDSCETNGYTGSRSGTLQESVVEISILKAHEKEQIRGRLNNHYSIYPNPASTAVIVASSTYTGPAEVRFYSSNGQLIESRNVSFENKRVQLSFELANGMYYFQIIDAKNGNTSKKLPINK